jgi:glyoxylase-like metal-dependent hydrolase (beta-lactamase superfamily II)
VTEVRAAIIPVTPFQQNCTLLWNDQTKKGAVIDPGGDLDRIRQAITEMGVTVEKIILTHGHIDHAGGAAQLKEDLGVPIEGPHEADRFLLDRLAETGQGYGIGDARASCTARAIRPAASYSCRQPSASPSWEMCCFRDRSAARICRVAMEKR